MVIEDTGGSIGLLVCLWFSPLNADVPQELPVLPETYWDLLDYFRPLLAAKTLCLLGRLELIAAPMYATKVLPEVISY